MSETTLAHGVPHQLEDVTANQSRPGFKYALILVLFVSLLAWYLYPIVAIAWFWLTTDRFQLLDESFVPFATALGSDSLGLNELPKLMIGLVSSSGLCLMLMERKQAGRTAEGFALLLLVLVLLSAFACVFSYHVLTFRAEAIESMYGASVSEYLMPQVASRFRELWTLIGALAGLTIVYERTAKEPT